MRLEFLMLFLKHSYNISGGIQHEQPKRHLV